VRQGISPDYLRAFQHIPPQHSDPFDRMLVAQAQVEKLALINKERHVQGYDVSVLW